MPADALSKRPLSNWQREALYANVVRLRAEMFELRHVEPQMRELFRVMRQSAGNHVCLLVRGHW